MEKGNLKERIKEYKEQTGYSNDLSSEEKKKIADDLIKSLTEPFSESDNTEIMKTYYNIRKGG